MNGTEEILSSISGERPAKKMRTEDSKLNLSENDAKYNQANFPKSAAVVEEDQKLCNPEGIKWNRSNTKARISKDGFIAINNNYERQNVVAEKGFSISVENCRKHNFSGNIIYYFEVTHKSSQHGRYCIGLTDEYFRADTGSSLGSYLFSHAIENGDDHCWIYGQGYRINFLGPVGAIKPKWNGICDVAGCGLILNSKNKCSMFFTLNGILMGKQRHVIYQYYRSCLYPTVSMSNVSVEANFGTDPVNKPFIYDIAKCPGLVF